MFIDEESLCKNNVVILFIDKFHYNSLIDTHV